jgi:hypothetical protein
LHFSITYYDKPDLIFGKCDHRWPQLEFWEWCGASLFLTKDTRRCRDEAQVVQHIFTLDRTVLQNVVHPRFPASRLYPTLFLGAKAPALEFKEVTSRNKLSFLGFLFYHLYTSLSELNSMLLNHELLLFYWDYGSPCCYQSHKIRTKGSQLGRPLRAKESTFNQSAQSTANFSWTQRSTSKDAISPYKRRRPEIGTKYVFVKSCVDFMNLSSLSCLSSP